MPGVWCVLVVPPNGGVDGDLEAVLLSEWLRAPELSSCAVDQLLLCTLSWNAVEQIQNEKHSLDF